MSEQLEVTLRGIEKQLKRIADRLELLEINEGALCTFECNSRMRV